MKRRAWNKKGLDYYESVAVIRSAPYAHLREPCRLLLENRNSFGVARKVYKLRHGAIPDHLYVCHHCDRPRCIEESHLWLGTQKQNMEDASKKNRINRVFSSAHCAAISKGKKGNTVISAEQRDKISKSLTGHKRSEAECRIISERMKRWHAQRRLENTRG